MSYRDDPNWPRKLNEYLNYAQQRYKAEGFVWGTFDCATFICDWILESTGDDPMADMRGKYNTYDSALDALRKYGEGTLLKTATKRLGKPIPAQEARRGDLAYRATEKCLGIVTIIGTRKRAFFLYEDKHGRNNLGALELKHCDKAFRL